MPTPRKNAPSLPEKTEIVTVAPGEERRARSEPPKAEAHAPTEQSPAATLAAPPGPAPEGPPTLDRGEAPPATTPPKKAKPALLRNPVQGYEILAELGRG